MKKISLIALSAVIVASGAFAVPAMAAPSAGAAPYCNSTTADLGIKDDYYANVLQKKGSTLDSVDIWNGCVKAIYTDGSGKVTTAFYDPDSLQLLDTMTAHEGKLG